MKHIGVISDTHGFINPRVFSFLKDCDEIWHVGDIGSVYAYETLEKFKPLRAVYGNIDGGSLRNELNEFEVFTIDKLKIVLVHIGGYPGNYSALGNSLIKKHKPDLFISGHSHILKVVPDNKNNLLHINPGAAGNSGIHHVITFIKFQIKSGIISDLEVCELPR